ncbi:GNAT family N-acetyltransferase [Fulvivirga ligni]|uniref:GNAT family N-acetyltransferase n=1 Tax=Fulvivirga ligni TaxID=2904246 RepID=UPI001F1D4A9E|nr:GNAT family N-acetyltransferase [Fulvivirga ligni]UII20086.1 GNAT family N-acetyltransferase [Fulvivirga ligni]
MEIKILEASLEEIISISHQIPEFQNPYQLADYHKRLDGIKYLALKAEVDGTLAGFKLGYDMGDDIFYSWFGAVLPDYRKHGLAKSLATTQEKWASEEGFRFIRTKTRNRFKPMLIFALKNGFSIIEIEKKTDIEENRILLEKALR